MKKHILIISQYFPPDITAAAFRIGSLCDFLLQNGYRITVLTSHPHKSNSDNSTPPPEEACRDLKLVRVPINSSNYILQYLTFIIRGFLKILPLAVKNRFDLVFATSPPLSVFSLGFIISRIKRAPLIMDIRDLWPDTPVALGKMRAESTGYRFFKRYETFMYRRSQWLTCVSAPMKEEISKSAPNGVSVIYNGIPEQAAASLPPPSIPKIDDDNPIRVFYYGNIGLAQGLDTLMDAAATVKRRIRFHIVGEGALKQSLSEKIRSQGLTNIHFEEPLPKRQLAALVNRQAHILFINLEDHPVFYRTIPSKVFDYLLHCLPVVYGIKGEGADILKKTHAAIPFESGSPDSLIEAIDSVVENYQALVQQARTNNPVIASQFTREKNYKKLLKIIQNHFSS